MRYRPALLSFFIPLLLLSVSACDRERVDPPPEPTVTTGAPVKEAAAADGEASIEERREHAMEAIFELRDTLMGRVMSVAADEGFPAAVDICNKEAIPLTKEVAERYEVRLGRTSEKLRNPENTAPSWVADLAQRAQAGPAFEEIEGTLRGVAPIRLAEGCVNCHGQPDQLASGVAQALATHYPDDQATGYAEGDLRGYFWIEVPSK